MNNPSLFSQFSSLLGRYRLHIKYLFVALSIVGIFSSTEAFIPSSVDFHNKVDGIILSERSAQGLAILAPVFKKTHINVSIAWGKGEYLDYNNISDFSSKIAIDFWGLSGKAIVVNSYVGALLASQIASIENIPILWYGNTTNLTLQILKCKYVIEIGDTPFEANLTLTNQEEVWRYTINLAKLHGINIDYIVVVNPDDENSVVKNLSSFGSLIAAYHNGILCTVSNDSKFIEMMIKRAIEELKNNGMEVNYICLVGDPFSLPFSLIPYEGFEVEEKNIATDNLYGDLDGDPLAPEIAVGRFLAKNLSDASALFDRYVNYEHYFDQESKWQETAWSWLPPESPFLCFPGRAKSAFSVKKTFEKAGFKTLRVIVMEAFRAEFFAEKSNYIFVAGIHGNPYELYKTYVEYWNLHPGVIFLVSCQAGKTDNISVEEGIVYTFIHNGIASYIAPTRITFAGWEIPFGDWSANLLGRLFFENLVKNISVGKALVEAKRCYYQICREKNVNDSLVLYEFVLYGDPAFNPYEPIENGKININANELFLKNIGRCINEENSRFGCNHISVKCYSSFVGS